MDEAEKLAKRVIESVLDDARMEFRDQQHGGGDLRHDFWLHRPNRDRAAVEVTSVRDEDRMRTAHKLAENDHVLEAEHCTRSWAVWLEPQTRYSKVKNRIDRYLAELESQRIDRVGPARFVSDHSAVGRIRSKLSVESAMSFKHKDSPARIYLHLGGAGGLVHASTVSDAVKGETPANKNKLAETGAFERHLFVFISHSDVAASALDRSDPSADRPDLPPEVTDAWATAERLGTKDQYAVWRAGRGEPWRSVGPVVVPGGGPAPLP